VRASAPCSVRQLSVKLCLGGDELFGDVKREGQQPGPGDLRILAITGKAVHAWRS
jgi:hypothetical protein